VALFASGYLFTACRRPTVILSPAGRVPSIAMRLSVCLSVRLSASVISRPHVKTTKFYIHITCGPQGAAMARFS